MTHLDYFAAHAPPMPAWYPINDAAGQIIVDAKEGDKGDAWMFKDFDAMEKLVNNIIRKAIFKKLMEPKKNEKI